MQFRVIGTDQTNRKPINTVIEAPSLERANMLARMKKIEVSSIEPMNGSTAPPESLDYAKPVKRKSKSRLLVVFILVVIALLAGAFLAGWLDI